MSNSNIQSFKPVLVYFKEAWTENSVEYLVYPSWTLNQFRDTLKPLIAMDFNLEPGSFDIVNAGQQLSENGQPIGQSNEIKLHHLWGQHLEVSFYIRRI